MTEIRCKKCNRLLAKGRGIWELTLEIKCPKCGYINLLEFRVKIGRRKPRNDEEYERYGPEIRYPAGEEVIVS